MQTVLWDLETRDSDVRPIPVRYVVSSFRRELVYLARIIRPASDRHVGINVAQIMLQSVQLTMTSAN